MPPSGYPLVSLGDDGTYGSGPYLGGTTYDCTLDNLEGLQTGVRATTPVACP